MEANDAFDAVFHSGVAVDSRCRTVITSTSSCSFSMLGLRVSPAFRRCNCRLTISIRGVYGKLGSGGILLFCTDQDENGNDIEVGA